MFNLTPEKVIESLKAKFSNNDWEWYLGNSQTQPHLLGIAETQYGNLVVLLDKELELPGHLIYAYGGSKYLFEDIRLGGLGGHKPNHSAFTNQDSGCNSWIYLMNESSALYYPFKLTHIAYGGNECLVWHEIR